MKRDIGRGCKQICIWCAADVSVNQTNTEVHQSWTRKQWSQKLEISLS